MTSPRFEILAAAEAVYTQGAVLGPAHINCFEFVWIIEGDVIWECDGVKHSVSPGTVFLMHPGTRQTFFWDPSKQTRHLYVMFNIKSGAKGYRFKNMPAILNPLENDVIRPLFRHVMWLVNEKPPGFEEVLTRAIDTMLKMYEHSLTETKLEMRSGLPESVLRALWFARSRRAKKITAVPTIAELAKAAGLSQAQLYRHFIKTFGIGPHSALRLELLDEAASLLARTQRPIKDIAADLGFFDPYHFSKSFKKIFGSSPRAFRGNINQPGFSVPLPALLRQRHLASGSWLR